MSWMVVFTAALVMSPRPFAGIDDKSKPAAGWETDYSAARAIARDAGKPMFVVFRCEK